MKELEKFIEENELRFDGAGSGLNSDCTILSGYALHLGITNIATISKAIKNKRPLVSSYRKELSKVFEYAENNNYGEWWSRPEAKKLYKF